MNMKLLSGVVVAVVAVTAVSQVGGFNDESGDFVEVVSATPVTRTVRVPWGQCRDVLVEQAVVTSDHDQNGMQDRNTAQQLQTVCETVYDHYEEPIGFDVTYQLDGNQQTVRMDHDPGRRLLVDNGVAVLDPAP